MVHPPVPCFTQTSSQPWLQASAQLPFGTPHDPHGSPLCEPGEQAGTVLVVVAGVTVVVEVAFPIVVEVVVAMVVVVEVVEVVLAGAQPVGVHASQQLAKVETQAVPPLGGTHLSVLLLIWHLVPFGVVRQQVTVPGLPQVETAAHVLTNRAQLLFVRTSFACCTAHFT
jgi:hypothetical protein